MNNRFIKAKTLYPIIITLFLIFMLPLSYAIDIQQILPIVFNDQPPVTAGSGICITSSNSISVCNSIVVNTITANSITTTNLISQNQYQSNVIFGNNAFIGNISVNNIYANVISANVYTSSNIFSIANLNAITVNFFYGNVPLFNLVGQQYVSSISAGTGISISATNQVSLLPLTAGTGISISNTNTITSTGVTSISGALGVAVNSYNGISLTNSLTVYNILTTNYLIFNNLYSTNAFSSVISNALTVNFFYGNVPLFNLVGQQYVSSISGALGVSVNAFNGISLTNSLTVYNVLTTNYLLFNTLFSTNTFSTITSNDFDFNDIAPLSLNTNITSNTFSFNSIYQTSASGNIIANYITANYYNGNLPFPINLKSEPTGIFLNTTPTPLDQQNSTLCSLSSSTTQCSISLSTSQPDEMLMVFVTANSLNNPSASISLSDSAGLGWTQRDSITTSLAGSFWEFNALTTAQITNDKITAKLSSGTGVSNTIYIMGFGVSGVQFSSPFDSALVPNNIASTTTTLSLTSNRVAASQNNDYLIFLVGMSGTGLNQGLKPFLDGTGAPNFEYSSNTFNGRTGVIYGFGDWIPNSATLCGNCNGNQAWLETPSFASGIFDYIHISNPANFIPTNRISFTGLETIAPLITAGVNGIQCPTCYSPINAPLIFGNSITSTNILTSNYIKFNTLFSSNIFSEIIANTFAFNFIIPIGLKTNITANTFSFNGLFQTSASGNIITNTITTNLIGIPSFSKMNINPTCSVAPCSFTFNNPNNAIEQMTFSINGYVGASVKIDENSLFNSIGITDFNVINMMLTSSNTFYTTPIIPFGSNVQITYSKNTILGANLIVT